MRQNSRAYDYPQDVLQDRRRRERTRSMLLIVNELGEMLPNDNSETIRRIRNYFRVDGIVFQRIWKETATTKQSHLSEFDDRLSSAY